jgi:hypothetical protein
MEINHIHVVVGDVNGALEHCRAIWGQEPGFVGAAMAVVPFGAVVLIFDRGEPESELTVGLASTDCDADYAAAVARGAEMVTAPADQRWGARTAYLKGPGKLTFELEQPLPRQ